MAKTIYLFRTPNGTKWADYQVPRSVPKKDVLGQFDLTNPQAVIDNPGKIIPERIKSLAHRHLLQLQFEVPEPVAVIPPKLVSLSLWQRLVWLITGKA